MHSMSAGIVTQRCIRSSYTENAGAGKAGSANAPTGMAMLSSLPDPCRSGSRAPFDKSYRMLRPGEHLGDRLIPVDTNRELLVA